MIIDSKLLAQIQKGDEAAFRQLYRLFQGKLFAYAWKLTKSRETAGEVVQFVFIKIWEKRAAINPEDNFEGYIMRIAQHYVFNLLRDVSRENERRTLLWNRIEQIRSNPAEDLYAKELTQIYREAIESLPDQQKRVYRLREQDFLSYTAIAEQLNISPLTVKKHMVEAVKRIRAHVKQFHQLDLSMILFWLLK